MGHTVEENRLMVSLLARREIQGDSMATRWTHSLTSELMVPSA